MEHEVRVRLEQPRRVDHGREVVFGLPGDDDVVAVPLEALHEMGAEEPAAAGDQNAHAGEGTVLSGLRLGF